MRRILLGLMTFLMFTPVLACGMAFCPDVAGAADPQPCHQTDNVGSEISGHKKGHNNGLGKSNNGPMLAIDCMGVDLFQQDVSHGAQFDLPDESLESIDYAWDDLSADYNFQLENISGIRGPPVWSRQTALGRSSVILTTQRFLL